MAFLNEQLSSAVSLGASYTSSVIDCSYYQAGSIILSWTGTPAGNFTVEISDDPDQASGSWILYTDSTQAAGGASGSKLYDFPSISFRYMRLKYTRSSSTGVLTAHYFIRGFF